ncbi:MAG TPA: response regulator [Opitutaceae bacterium]|nr:response regulator [Opitutaceae bacterium]
MKTSDHRGKHVLIVDDVPANLSVLYDFLQDSGFKVLVAESGTGALEQLAYMDPHIVLLDVMMPGIDGFETCRRIKSREAFKNVPVFFMTALADPIDRVKGFEAGAVDYINKPIYPEEVLARIRAHLDIRALQEALEKKNQELEEKNERLDQAIQLRRKAESELKRSIDRAVIVSDETRELRFCTQTAAELMMRFFPETSLGLLPADLCQWALLHPGDIRRYGKGKNELEVRSCERANERGCFVLLLEEKAARPTPEALLSLGITPREAEILFWVAQGKTSPEIAVILETAPNTVKKHVQNMLPKIGVETRLAAALKAMEIMGFPG